jgi:hypothetical protein
MPIYSDGGPWPTFSDVARSAWQSRPFGVPIGARAECEQCPALNETE